MSIIYDKMFLQNENNKKYKQLIHISETNKNLNKGINEEWIKKKNIKRG